MKTAAIAAGLLALAARTVVAEDDGAFRAELQKNASTTLQGQIDLFNEVQGLVQGNTTDQNGNNFDGQGSQDVDQEGTTLDSSQINVGSQFDGQTQPGADAGQVASLTSQNNFINFCATQNMPLANGLQFRDTESCIPIPMGAMPKVDNIPTTAFFNPKQNANLKSQTAINVQVRTTNMNLGNFVNAASNYYSAPQQLDQSGKIVGHTHMVCHDIDSIDSTTNVNSATDFVFFKGVNTAQSSAGILTATIAAGLPNGAYRCCTMLSASNHQPVLVPIAQRISQDDCTRFTVSDDGDANANKGDADSAAETKQALADAAAAFEDGGAAASSPPPASTNQNNSNDGQDDSGNSDGQDNGQNGNGKKNNRLARSIRREARRSRQHANAVRHRM